MAIPEKPEERTEFVPEFYLRELKSAARKGEFPLVESLLADYAARFTKDPFYAEALSWVARSCSSKGFTEEARAYASQAFALALGLLDGRIAEPEAPLAMAAGAAIEVQSQLMLAELGERAAIHYLQEQLETFRTQPFSIRIRKNLHTVSLAGQPAPELDWSPLPGTTPGSAALLRGPSLIFFWAHWCSDSRAQARTLTRLRESPETAVVLVAPTRLFGYLTKGNPVGEEEELAHLAEIRRVDYPVLAHTAIPCGNSNFEDYGVSTFPTLVGVCGDGRVGFFHAGVLKADDLGERLRKLQ